MALLYPEESYKINGVLYEVHKELGPKLGLLVNFNAEMIHPERIVRY